MRFNALVPFDINGTSLELVLHYPETLLDFPAPVIYSNDIRYFILQVCAYRIETVKSLLGRYGLGIDKVVVVFCDLALVCRANFANKTFVVVLVGLFQFGRIRLNQFLCPRDLSIPDSALIVPVLNGVCDN